MNVLVLVGSPRSASLNARLAAAAVSALPDGVSTASFDLNTLPLYDPDLDALGNLGETVVDFRAAVAAADVLVVASPAYNGGMSAAIKNAIDIASRPRGAAPLLDKPVALLTAMAIPHTGVNVLEQLALVLRIAGARPVGAGVAASIVTDFTEAGVADPVRRQLDTLISELLAATATGTEGRASAA